MSLVAAVVAAATRARAAAVAAAAATTSAAATVASLDVRHRCARRLACDSAAAVAATQRRWSTSTHRRARVQ